MGTFQPGLMTDFACVEVAENEFEGEETLAELEVNVQDEGNTVWFTAYVTWTAPNANINTLNLRILREDDSEVCMTEERPTAADSAATTTITCCDQNPMEGDRTYRLVASRVSGATVSQGTFTAAVINT